MEKVTRTANTIQLRQRRMEVEMTLQHLEREKRQVESNTEWLNYAAYKNRLRFLDRVTTWYRNEMVEIDSALSASRTVDSPAMQQIENLSNTIAYSIRGK